ncbi:carbon-nitrogen hydrolase family protein [Planctomycetota bacterium]
MAQGKLKIATCQFAVRKSIWKNSHNILDNMRQAKKARADLVHFSECALSGYAGAELESTDQLDWDLLRDRTREIMQLARRFKLWVVLGSTHQLTGPNKPHNSLYLINPAGRIADRYDKRFCTERDLLHYSAGNRFVTFKVNGIKCALLICFDLRYPELYRELKKLKVDCIIQSFYNARQKKRSIHTDIMRQSMQCRAASNYFWVSMSNTNAYYSPYPSCFIRPDGRIIGQLKFHRPGLMVNTVDINKKFEDGMARFRPLAMKGALSSGPKINDPRSRKINIL